MSLTRSLRVLLVASLALGVLALPRPAGACGASTPVYTLDVETKWNKKVYRPGEIAKVTVTVMRPGDYDPLGNGIPNPITERTAAEGVDVTTTVLTGWPYPWDGGVTDADGKVHFKMKLPGDVRGPVDTYTHASMVHNRNGAMCTEIQEMGGKGEYPAFAVR